MGSRLPGQAAKQYRLDTTNTDKAISNATTGDNKIDRLVQLIGAIVKANSKDVYGNGRDQKVRYTTDLIISRFKSELEYQLNTSNNSLVEKVDALSQTLELKEDKDTSASEAYEFNAKLKDIFSEKQKEFQTLFEQLFEKQIAEYEAKQQEFSEQQAKLAAEFAFDKSNESNRSQISELKKFFQTKTNNSMQNSLSKERTLQIANKQTAAMKFAKNSALAIIVSEAITVSMAKNAKKLTETTNKMQGMQSPDNLTKINKSIAKKDSLGKKIAKIALGVITQPIKYLILKPIGFLFKKLWGLIKLPFKILKDLSLKIFSGLLKGTFNVVANFLRTPAGMFALGYLLGFIWKRWVSPLVNKVKNWWNGTFLPFLETYVYPILEPFKRWFGGELTFVDACSAAWDKLKEKVWTDWLKPKFDNFKKEHPILSWAAELAADHPIITGLLGYFLPKLTKKLTGKIFKKIGGKLFLTVIKGLSRLLRCFGWSAATPFALSIATFYAMWKEAAKAKENAKEVIVNGGHSKYAVNDALLQDRLLHPEKVANRFTQIGNDEFYKRINKYVLGSAKIENIVEDILANSYNNVDVASQAKGSQNLATVMALLSTATPLQAKEILDKLEKSNGHKSKELLTMLKEISNKSFVRDTYMSDEKFKAGILSIQKAKEDNVWDSAFKSLKKTSLIESAEDINYATQQIFQTKIFQNIKDSGTITPEMLLKSLDDAMKEKQLNHKENTIDYRILKELRTDISNGNNNIVQLLTMLLTKQNTTNTTNILLNQQSDNQTTIGI